MKYRNTTLAQAIAMVAILASVTVASADVFPIEHGRYFEKSVDCANPGKATVFIYDGKAFSHETTSCSVDQLSASGRKYEFQEQCAYRRKAWSILPTTVNDFKSSLEVHNSREFSLLREINGSEIGGHYRLCAPL